MTITVSHIGLSEKDVTLLVSIFSVLGSSSRVNDELVFVREEQQKLAQKAKANTDQEINFVGEEQRRSPGRLADIVFIDADNKVTVEIWDKLKKSNPLTIPIMVAHKDNNDVMGGYILRRPIMLKRLMAVLAEVTNTACKEKKPQCSGLLNILVVDDSFPVRKYMEYILPQLVGGEIKIDFAISGEEAVIKMKDQFYGLVFLDVIMPGIDGYKTCKLIKSKHSSQVVMLTSKKSPFDKVRGTMSGCDAYLTKPPKDAQLKKVLDKCMEDTNSFYRSAKTENN